MDKIKLRVLKVDQPIGEFYIGSIDARKLNEIATVEVREFKDAKAKDIAGIQRKLSPTRLRVGFETHDALAMRRTRSMIEAA